MLSSRPLRSNETPQDLAREGYNSTAKAYNDWSSTLVDRRTPYAEKLIDLLTTSPAVSLSTDGPRVLEIGCGAGTQSMMKLVQSPKIDHVVGIDISIAQLELARAAFETAVVPQTRFELIEADMLEVEFSSQTFDAVCAFYSLIHLSQKQQPVMLRKWFDWIKPGGYVIFNVAEQQNEGGVMDGWLGMQSGAFWASFGKDGTLHILRDIGFVVDEVTTTQDSGDAPFVWIIARKPVSDT